MLVAVLAVWRTVSQSTIFACGSLLRPLQHAWRPAWLHTVQGHLELVSVDDCTGAVQWLYSVYTAYIQPVHGPVQCLYSVYTAYMLYIRYIQHIQHIWLYRLYIRCIQRIYSLYTALYSACTAYIQHICCIQPVQRIYSIYAVYTLCTAYIQHIHAVATLCTVVASWERSDVKSESHISGARVRPRVITCARIMCARGRARAPARGDKPLSCSRSCNGVEDYYLAVLDPSMGILCTA